MCSVCGDWEVGKEIGSTEFCSQMCEDHAHAHRYRSAGTGWVDDTVHGQPGAEDLLALELFRDMKRREF
jgi:hypothetical protein